MDELTKTLQSELQQVNEKLSQLNERYLSLKHQYESDKKAILLSATVFVVLTLAFFGLSFQRIGDVVDDTGLQAALAITKDASDRAKESAVRAKDSADRANNSANRANRLEESINGIKARVSQQRDNILLQKKNFSEVVIQETQNVKNTTSKFSLIENYFETNSRHRLELLDKLIETLLANYDNKAQKAIEVLERKIENDVKQSIEAMVGTQDATSRGLKILSCIEHHSEKEICKLPSGLQIYTSCFQCLSQKGQIEFR